MSREFFRSIGRDVLAGPPASSLPMPEGRGEGAPTTPGVLHPQGDAGRIEKLQLRDRCGAVANDMGATVVIAPRKNAHWILRAMWACSITVAISGGWWFPSQLPGQVRNIDAMRRINPRMPAPLEIDLERIRAAGISRHSGRHIDLYTDIRDAQMIAQWVDVFDQAVPQWCHYFDIPEHRADAWFLSAVVMSDPTNDAAFRKAGLIPDDLPRFLAGYNRGHEFWVLLQPGDYYTRHLILHEGTHAFMQWFLGGSGPAWYSEGMAELLALHRFVDGKLTLGYRVYSRDECPWWGRVKRIREDVAQGNVMMLDQVLAIPAISFRDVSAYAWSWAACEFFSRHPLSQAMFDELPKLASDTTPHFNQRFQSALRGDWDVLERDWQLMVREIDYGYDIRRGMLTAAQQIDERRFRIRADHSWQSAVQVRAGDRLEITADGMFTVARMGARELKASPDGITYDYYRGQPLGKLWTGLLNDDRPGVVQGEQPIGRQGSWIAPADGVVVLRLGDSPARMGDNEGDVAVEIRGSKGR